MLDRVDLPRAKTTVIAEPIDVDPMSVAKPSILVLPLPSMPHSLTGLPTFWFSRTILFGVEAVAVLVVLNELAVKE
jgi:hypothetical protein